jgi:hypothetical protein
MSGPAKLEKKVKALWNATLWPRLCRDSTGPAMFLGSVFASFQKWNKNISTNDM